MILHRGVPSANISQFQFCQYRESLLRMGKNKLIGVFIIAGGDRF
jgi:hypothetical protein